LVHAQAAQQQTLLEATASGPVGAVLAITIVLVLLVIMLRLG
jgi:hypothetical protein